MTIHHIQVFCEVCEQGTMSQAAVKLNMTQPGVSRIIADLEGYYQIVLFLRKNRRLFLTPAGKQFYQDAKKVLQAFNRLEANATHDHETKSLVLGCTSGFGSSLVRDIEHIFNQKYPHCKLYLRDTSSKKIQDMVLRGECNLALVQHEPSDPRLYQFPFSNSSLVAVSKPGYKLRSTAQVLSIEDLARENLILLEKERLTRSIIDGEASEKGIFLDPVWTCSSPSNVRELAQQGEGIAILFELQVKKSLEEGLLVRIPTTLSVKREFYIIYRKDNWLSEEEEYLIELCHKHAPSSIS
ncbi:MAG: LysR family transcriptional regulator [Spirochaetales bacterium]|nr:LysR family transcriptional regulator [Candidatus Physcosoma equi]